MEQFLQMIGEEALRTLPLAIALAVVFALFAVYLTYQGVIEENREKLVAGVAMLLLGLGFVSWTWSETAELCRATRDTDFWADNKCHIVDPDGRPILRSPPIDLTPG